MNRAAVDSMLTNSLGSSFSAAFQFRSSMEGGLDGLDFSDNLDLDFDDFFTEEGNANQDDSFRDSIMAAFDRGSAVGSFEKVTSDVNMATPEANHPQYDFLGSTSTHSLPAPKMGGAGAYQRTQRRQTINSVQEFRPESLKRPPCRRVSTNSVPACLPQVMERYAAGENPADSFDEYGYQGNPHMSGQLPRRHSEFMLVDTEMEDTSSRRQFQFNAPDFGNDQVPPEVDLAMNEATEQIIRLQSLVGQDQTGQGLMNGSVGGGNHHRHGNNPHSQSMTYQRGPPGYVQMRSASERNLPWAPSGPPQNTEEMQQNTLQQVTMAKLQAAMERTSSTMKLLQDWDRAHGLPASHCQTMVNSSRSRKQLKDGVVLKKWNGSPLLRGGI